MQIGTYKPRKVEKVELNNYGIILAGGKGRRLWPYSTERIPKQFIDFFGVGRTQLQQTFDRIVNILPKENIYVSTNIAYIDIVREQLPMLDEAQIIAEPIFRNTAPSVAWAIHRIGSLNPEANVLIVPSDHNVINVEAFKQDVCNGFSFVTSNDAVLTVGVEPTRFESGYGYLQKNEADSVGSIYKVQAFIEKPDADFASMFVGNGEWCWNTGMYISSVNYLRSILGQNLPPILRHFDALHSPYNVEAEDKYMQDYFAFYNNISLEECILEKQANVYVMECKFGWADLGTWHNMYESIRTENDENVVLNSEVFFEEATNNIIRMPKDKIAVIQGLDGYIVVEEGNVLLICKKDVSPSFIKKYINEVRMRREKAKAK